MFDYTNDVLTATHGIWDLQLIDVTHGYKIVTEVGQEVPNLDPDFVVIAVCLVNKYERYINTILSAIPSSEILDPVFSMSVSSSFYNLCVPGECPFLYNSISSTQSLASMYMDLPSTWRKLLRQKLHEISKAYSLAVYPSRECPQELQLICTKALQD